MLVVPLLVRAGSALANNSMVWVQVAIDDVDSSSSRVQRLYLHTRQKPLSLSLPSPRSTTKRPDKDKPRGSHENLPSVRSPQASPNPVTPAPTPAAGPDAYAPVCHEARRLRARVRRRAGGELREWRVARRVSLLGRAARDWPRAQRAPARQVALGLGRRAGAAQLGLRAGGAQCVTHLVAQSERATRRQLYVQREPYAARTRCASKCPTRTNSPQCTAVQRLLCVQSREVLSHTHVGELLTVLGLCLLLYFLRSTRVLTSYQISFALARCLHFHVRKVCVYEYNFRVCSCAFVRAAVSASPFLTSGPPHVL